MNLEGCSYADWASNIDDRKSMSGICVFLVVIVSPHKYLRIFIIIFIIYSGYELIQT